MKLSSNSNCNKTFMLKDSDKIAVIVSDPNNVGTIRIYTYGWIYIKIYICWKFSHMFGQFKSVLEYFLCDLFLMPKLILLTQGISKFILLEYLLLDIKLKVTKTITINKTLQCLRLSHDKTHILCRQIGILLP